MYNEYWHLKEKPFENTPDPRFIYWSDQHEETLSRMLYVIKERKGAALITGEYGSGKTLLTRVLLEKLMGDQYQPALILNPMLSPTQLVKEVIVQLGGTVAASASKAKAFNSLNEMLVELDKKKKLAVVVVDEAQAIHRVASFEEFRLMLNFQLNDRFLLTLILIGQPELNDKVEKLPQLMQRFALRYHLKALKEAETKNYIAHRLKVAGGNPAVFSAEAVAGIYQYSGGIPRKINNACDLALLVGSSENAKAIDARIVAKVVADLEGKEYGAL